MASNKVHPSERYMYIRRRFIYLKTTAKTIKKFTKRYNLKKDLYVYISKEDEDRCKKPLIIYNNIRETEEFEKKKKELLERNKTRHGKNKCKFTFSERANAEFAFLKQNVEFTESKLRAAAREMKMDLHEFMAYYSHKKKLHIEAKAKHQVIRSPNKHTREKCKVGKNKSIKKIPQRMQERLHFHAHSTQKNHNPGMLSFGKSGGEISNSEEDIHPFTEKIKSTKLAAAPNENTENEFCKKRKRKEKMFKEEEDLYICPEVLSMGKIKQELRVCLTNIDMHLKKYRVENSVEDGYNSHSFKEKIENAKYVALPSEDTENGEKEERKRKITRVPEREELHIYPEGKIQKDLRVYVTNIDVEVKSHAQHTRSHTAVKRKYQGETERARKIPRSLHESVSIDTYKTSTEEKRNVDSTHPPDAGEKELSNTVENIHSSKEKIGKDIEIAIALDGNIEIEKKKENEKKITLSPEREDLHSYPELSGGDPYACDLSTSMYTSEAEFVVTDMKVKSQVQHTHSYTATENAIEIPQKNLVKEELAFYTHFNTDKNENDSNSVEEICSFKEKIGESSEIAVISNENEFCIKQNEERELTPEREVLYIYPEEENIQEDLHVCAQPVAEESAVQSGPPQTVDRLSFHMYSFPEKNHKNVCVNTHPTPDSSDEEIKDIQHVFPHSTEIVDGSSENPEDTLQHYFSEKLVHIEESSEGIPEDSHVCANPAEESDVYIIPEDTHAMQCENVPDEDLDFLLPTNYVHDTLERERDEISGEGYFSLSFLPFSHSKQYEDISNDSNISLPDDHTYDMGDNYAPSCSVEDKAPVLQSESINEFVCVRNVWANENIAESLSAPGLSEVAIPPPFNNKFEEEDKTVISGSKVTVSLPYVFAREEVVFFNENEWEEKNMLDISVYPNKRNDRFTNNSFKLCNLPSNSVPNYDAASFYDMVSSEILEDKILEK